MAVRIDIEFPYPLGKETRTDFLLAIGDLAKAERVYFGRSGFNAVVMGEAMSREKVIAKLREYGLQPESVVSSLSEEEDSVADEKPSAGRTERYKPIGRGG